MIKEQNIDHRELINDHKLIWQRVLFVSLIGVVVWGIFQQSVKCLCLHAGSLCETLGRSSCWRSKRNIDFAPSQQHQQGAERGGLARSWPSGQNAYLPAISRLHRFPLFLCQVHIALLSKEVEDSFPRLLRHRGKRTGGTQQDAQEAG